MSTTNALEQTADKEPGAQDTVDTVEAIALEDVTGGWLYSPYALANPYALARYEARLERRAEWLEGRAARWWGC